MMEEKFDQQDKNWDNVKGIMGDYKVTLGRYYSYLLMNTPRRMLYSISYYKFASKMIGSSKRVLDVGCGEGIGTWLLSVECGNAEGVDIDQEAINIAEANWKDRRITFRCSDFFDIQDEKWDAIVSMDMIGHLIPENSSYFFEKVAKSLEYDGIVVVGIPNVTSEQYANEITKASQRNFYSAERLYNEMEKYFNHIFLFGANDEVIHTGFMPMAHYLIAIGCHKKI